MTLCMSHPGHVHADYISCVSYSPDGIHLASSSADRHVRLRVWDAHDGSLVAQWNSSDVHMHKAMIKAVSRSPDGLKLATIGFEGSIKVWALEAGVDSPRMLLS